jgi:hypothetical protein
MTFRARNGKKTFLSVDWKRGLLGGEGGLEVWRAGQDKSNLAGIDRS